MPLIRFLSAQNLPQLLKTVRRSMLGADLDMIRLCFQKILFLQARYMRNSGTIYRTLKRVEW